MPWTIRINSLKTPLTESAALQSKLLKDERGHSERRPLRSALCNSFGFGGHNVALCARAYRS